MWWSFYKILVVQSLKSFWVGEHTEISGCLCTLNTGTEPCVLRALPGLLFVRRLSICLFIHTHYIFHRKPLNVSVTLCFRVKQQTVGPKEWVIETAVYIWSARNTGDKLGPAFGIWRVFGKQGAILQDWDLNLWNWILSRWIMSELVNLWNTLILSQRIAWCLENPHMWYQKYCVWRGESQEECVFSVCIETISLSTGDGAVNNRLILHLCEAYIPEEI